MGLWLKQGDDIIPVSGGGGGGTFEGEHVLTGDPDDPPTGWEEGQLLWDGNTTAYDGDEIINEGGGHNHEALYLGLEGGTLTGDLQVDGVIQAATGSTATPSIRFASSNTTGFYGHADGDRVYTNVNGEWKLIVYDNYFRVADDLRVEGSARVVGDLQVDGAATVEGKRVVTVTTSNGTPPSGASEGDIHIQV
jgi:hypothetical protein